MRIIKGCSTSCLVLIVVFIVAGLLFLAETTTPLGTWLYQHNYYFADLVNFLHGKH